MSNPCSRTASSRSSSYKPTADRLQNDVNKLKKKTNCLCEDVIELQQEINNLSPTGLSPFTAGTGSSRIVKLNPAFPGYTGTEDFVVPVGSLDFKVTPIPYSRMGFDFSQSAIRAGVTTATQWDEAFRGDHSVAFGNDTVASATGAVVSGGTRNTGSGTNCTIGGGFTNTVSATYGTISGGDRNVLSGTASTIGGGTTNTVSDVNSTISGGSSNTASGSSSTIGGGIQNVASASFTTVAGGFDNNATSQGGAICGGERNFSTASSAFVGAGTNNVAQGDRAAVGAGTYNRASADDSAIPGGSLNTINAPGVNGWAGGYSSTVNHANSFVRSDSTARSSLAANTVRFGAAGGFRIDGDLDITGTLSKGLGFFKIDHPLDPEHKYLYHSFVESNDMMNIYNGNVTLDNNGEATVRLPDWFEALNRDYRYQLTGIGESMAGYTPYIKSKLQDFEFVIAGGAAGGEVSWLITGIRQDKFANENPLVVEVDK